MAKLPAVAKIPDLTRKPFSDSQHLKAFVCILLCDSYYSFPSNLIYLLQQKVGFSTRSCCAINGTIKAFW